MSCRQHTYLPSIFIIAIREGEFNLVLLAAEAPPVLPGETHDTSNAVACNSVSFIYLFIFTMNENLNFRWRKPV